MSSSRDQPGLLRLSAHPNNYEWGKVGSDSLAAKVAPAAEGSGFELDEQKPYAELWMGTHPNNPSHLYGKEILLSDYLRGRPKLLGDAVKFPARYPGSGPKENADGHVPFLFKILTCKQALPLQIHPDVELAKKLHSDDPDKFPDTNHKPEIAVCLSDSFYGFAHFRPLKEIQGLIDTVPELDDLSESVKKSLSTLKDGHGSSNSAIKDAWQAILNLFGQDKYSKVVNGFTKRVKSEGPSAFKDAVSSNGAEDLAHACKILDEYNHGDVSIFATLLFMNLVKLKKGEGIYVGADGPHAWLQGEIVELMAASDNVLNVGFTPEQDNVQTVIRAITGKSFSVSDISLNSTTFSKSSKGNTRVYSVPFEEFSIMHITGPDTLEALSGPGIAIALKATRLQGEGVPMGSVWFVPAGTELSIEGDGEVWMAFYDSKSDQKEVGKN
ncbi:putative mannose-6-phosphateisomerase [Kockovaella imperatae]|uniref:Mannose-6-phosphate isomerase n=1 Tax=Kockovaella imperatae TaxID=4999 RepID=A0A1Y1UH55_9TREE|nr:putative mannose-6-phosphateisomerase [Kockovaella imperatae]ORX37362.1 putative mannose-6-phosphateisomerase [Kockovaella imperatae]